VALRPEMPGVPFPMGIRDQLATDVSSRPAQAFHDREPIRRQTRSAVAVMLPDRVTKQARAEAVDILYGSARRSLVGLAMPITVTEADVASLVIVGWSIAHGYATLLATENLADRPSGDIFRGVELLASPPKGDEATRSPQFVEIPAPRPDRPGSARLICESCQRH
jgi:hypothetical protein